MYRLIARTVSALAAVLFFTVVRPAGASPNQAIIPNLPASPFFSVSTVPPNGDVNPYGVAFVPGGFPSNGATQSGDILVSNFNNNMNTQGTGTTIVSVPPTGQPSVFFQGLPGLGLTTALGALKAGFVLVGDVPTTDGSFATIQPGGLLVLNKHGNVVATLTDPKLLDGPWDLTIADYGNFAQVFVSNVLSGTVTRIDLFVPNDRDFFVQDMVQVASGYTHAPNGPALVVGPTGLVYDPARDLLYVASTGDNEIFAVSHVGFSHHDQGMGRLVYADNAHLRGPLALAQAPNGDLLTANGDAINADPNSPSEIVEFTPAGQFVDEFSVDTGGEGGAFGLALQSSSNGKHVIFAAVDDIQNALDVWHVSL